MLKSDALLKRNYILQAFKESISKEKAKPLILPLLLQNPVLLLAEAVKGFMNLELLFKKF